MPRMRVAGVASKPPGFTLLVWVLYALVDPLPPSVSGSAGRLPAPPINVSCIPTRRTLHHWSTPATLHLAAVTSSACNRAKQELATVTAHMQTGETDGLAST